MDTCASESCGDSAWPATKESSLSEGDAENSHPLVGEPIPKNLTTEAMIMILVILFFILLAVIGSSITAFKYFFKVTKQKCKSETKEKSIRTGISNGMDKKGWVKIFESFFHCFCVFRNAKIILNPVLVDGHFKILHFLRAFCVYWVILCHYCMLVGMSFSSFEKSAGQTPLKMWIFQFILNGFFTVDGFIVISGFLNGISFCNHYDKNKGSIKWISFFLKRYLRITPVYMIVLGFYATLFPYFGSGPLWKFCNPNPSCKKNWWYNVLYISNFLPYKNQCMPWSWYLSVEMQVFVISPIFLVCMLRRPRFGYALAGVTVFVSCFANFVVSKYFNLVDGFSRLGNHIDELGVFQKRVGEYFDKSYIKPHMRISSYLVGLTLGYYLCKRRSIKVKTTTLISYCGWTIFIFCVVVGIFGMHLREESVTETAIYNGVKHLLFSYTFAWIIFVFATKERGSRSKKIMNLGSINQSLAQKILFPISSTSYCAYLIHVMILEGYFMKFGKMKEFDLTLTVITHYYLLLWIFVAAFLVSLLFEQPVLRLLSLSQAEVNKESKNL